MRWLEAPRFRRSWALAGLLAALALVLPASGGEHALREIKDPIERLLVWLTSDDPHRRQYAERNLINASPDAIPALVKFLRGHLADMESQLWETTYLILERGVRLHHDDPHLDDGLLRMSPRKTDTRTFGGIDFVWIPEGPFVAGTRIESELVLHGGIPYSHRTEVQRVSLPGFWISNTEVTEAQATQSGFPARMRALANPELRKNPDLASRVPANINFPDDDQALGAALKAFLNRVTQAVRQQGHELVADLPTERQWEKAARGDDARLYPWGNLLATGRQGIPELAGKNSRWPRPVGTTPVDTSPYGVKDMVGNVSELVRRSGPGCPFEIKAGDFVLVVRGCAVDHNGFFEPLVAYRSNNGPVGIRLVLNPPAAGERQGRK